MVRLAGETVHQLVLQILEGNATPPVAFPAEFGWAARRLVEQLPWVSPIVVHCDQAQDSLSAERCRVALREHEQFAHEAFVRNPVAGTQRLAGAVAQYGFAFARTEVHHDHSPAVAIAGKGQHAITKRRNPRLSYARLLAVRNDGAGQKHGDRGRLDRQPGPLPPPIFSHPDMHDHQPYVAASPDYSWMRVARATRRRCGWAHGVEEPEGTAAHYVEGAGASTSSHSEWVVVRSRAFVNSPG